MLLKIISNRVCVRKLFISYSKLSFEFSIENVPLPTSKKQNNRQIEQTYKRFELLWPILVEGCPYSLKSMIFINPFYPPYLYQISKMLYMNMLDFTETFLLSIFFTLGVYLFGKL